MVDCGTVEILPAFDTNAVEIVNCNVDTNTAIAGQDTINATAEVRNNNPDAAAAATANFNAGSASASESVTVQPGRTASATASFVFDEPGSYTIQVSLGNVSEA